MEPLEPSLVQHFKGHTGTITSLAFNPSGKALASSSEDNSFLVWNLASNKSSLRYKVKPLPVTYVTYSPQGNLLASSQGDFVRLWMSSVRAKSIEFKPHLGTVRSVEFSTDGEKLLTASNDKSIKVWMACRRKFLNSFTGHTNWVKLAKYSPDGNLVVSCSDDRTVRLWDPDSSKCIHSFSEMKGNPKHVNFHPTGSCIGVAMSHNVVKLYDLRAMKLLQYYDCHKSQVNSLAFHPSGSYMVTASDDNTSKMIDIFEARVIFTIEAHTKGVTAVEFSKTGEFFATGSEDKNVYVWKSNIETIAEDLIDDKEKKYLRESVCNNYDPNHPKIQIKPSNLNLNSTHIEDVYSPKDYEAQSDDPLVSDKEKESTPAPTPRKATTPDINSTSGDGLFSLLELLTFENEKLKCQIASLEGKVSNLESTLFKKIHALEERLNDL